MKFGENGDALFEARIIDLAERAERYEVGFSAFLTPKEQIIASRILAQRKFDAVSFFFGGYGESERNRLFLLPDYMANEDGYGIENIFENYGEIVSDAVCAVKILGSGYKKLTHRDYMGSLLGLGVERSVVGDIAVMDDFNAVVFCDPKMSDFFVNELKKVGNDTVKTVKFDPPIDFSNPRKFQAVTDTVASARFDCVVSALTGLSREKAQGAIRIGDAELDYFTEEKADKTVCEGSIISVRGHGKYVVLGLSEQTKKGRLRLVANKYI